jgi:hypothetical protein
MKYLPKGITIESEAPGDKNKYAERYFSENSDF